MWEEVCFISESGRRVECQIKHFDECSRFGIDGGRISKLLMLAGGQVVASYDRGWDIRPAGGDIQGIYKALIERWN